MNDDVFDVTLRNHIRPGVVTTNHVPHKEIYKSVKLATVKFIKKEYLDALRISWILIKSDLNFTYAPYIIGYCYDYGLELKKNITRAIGFYLLAAHSGLYFSQLRLAQIYNSQAVENPKNKIFYYNMAYIFYIHAYRNYEATFYDKIKLTYAIAKVRFVMYMNNVKVDGKEVILLDPNDIKHILVNECSELDSILKN